MTGTEGLTDVVFLSIAGVVQPEKECGVAHAEAVDSRGAVIVPVDPGREFTAAHRGVVDGDLVVNVVFVVILETRLILEIEMQGHVEIGRRSFAPRIPERRPLPGLDLEERAASLEDVGAEINRLHRRTSIAQIGKTLERRQFLRVGVVSLNKNRAVCLSNPTP